jgi:hypothetical protein
MERDKKSETQDFSQAPGNCMSIVRQIFGGFLDSIRQSDEMHTRVSHYH